MRAKFKAKVKRGICFDESGNQYIAERMIIAPKLKRSHLVTEIDFCDINNSSRLDRLVGSRGIELMADKALEKRYRGHRIDLSKVESQGEFLASVCVKIS